MLAYGIGQPVQRLISVDRTHTGSWEELQKKMKDNPELVRAVEKIIAEAKKGLTTDTGGQT